MGLFKKVSRAILQPLSTKFATPKGYDLVCKRCGMEKRRPYNGKYRHCLRHIPENKYNWVDIKQKLPKRNKWVLVKSNAYGIKKGKFIKRWEEFNKNDFIIECKNNYDHSVVQWAELND